MPQRDTGKHKKRGFIEFRKTGSGSVIGETLELECLRKARTEVAIELSVSSRGVGKTYIATAIVREITEGKRAEEALRESEEQYRNLVNTINDLVFTVDTEGNILFANSLSSRFTRLNDTITIYYPRVEFGKNMRSVS